MFTHLLIATDGSELASKAVTTGLSLAKALNAKVTFIAVTEPRTQIFPEAVATPPADESDVARATAARMILANAQADAGKLGVESEAVHVPNDYPAEAILKEARGRGCDAIVMASHGRRGVASLLLGGETQRVVTGSTIPVVVCR